MTRQILIRINGNKNLPSRLRAALARMSCSRMYQIILYVHKICRFLRGEIQRSIIELSVVDLIFAWPWIIDMNNIDNQLDAIITVY